MSCRTDRLEGGGLERRLIAHILGCEALLRVMSEAEQMALPDWYVPETYADKAERVRMRWPEVTILPWEAGTGGRSGAFRLRVSSP